MMVIIGAPKTIKATMVLVCTYLDKVVERKCCLMKVICQSLMMAHDLHGLPTNQYNFFLRCIFLALNLCIVNEECSELTFTCSNSTIETLEKDVEYVQS